MTASRETNVARPLSAHRPSFSSTAPSIPTRQPASRTHSHSLSVGSINPAHRVTRRKSMSSTAVNNAAVVAAVKGTAALLESSSLSSKRNTAPRGGAAPRGSNTDSYPSLPSSLPNNGAVFGGSGYDAKNGSAVTDGPPLASMPDNETGNGKARIRRASEGSRLSKGEGKRGSGADLRCEKCGKGYKHSSCLTKHLWEHTPEWAFTSKLLISKHQQVQLLEAASVLVAMNQEATTAVESDHSSASPAASPAASGSSDMRDDELSSTDTTPPPQAADDAAVGSYSTTPAHSTHAKRHSAASSAYSQSYQSTAGTSVYSESAPNGRAYMSHYRQWSTDINNNNNRSATSTTSGSVAGSTSYRFDDEDQADLAAAVGLLSCSFGTPKSGPVMLPADVPPVPPLPAKFLGQSANALSGCTLTAAGSEAHQRVRSPPRPDYSPYIPDQDIEMGDEDSEGEEEEGDFGRREMARGGSEEDEEEEGVFGTMEE